MPFSNYEPEVIDITDMEEEAAIFQNVHVVDFDPHQFTIPGIMGDDDDSDDESTLSMNEAEILEGFLTPPTTPPRLTLHDLTTDEDEVPIPAAEADTEMELDEEIVWNPENFTQNMSFDLPENIVNIFETPRNNYIVNTEFPEPPQLVRNTSYADFTFTDLANDPVVRQLTFN